MPQLSAIFLYFKSGTDVLQARQLVQERLRRPRSTLPIVGRAAGAVPDRVGHQPGDADRDHLEDASTPLDLSTIAQYTIRPRLLHVPGVANVAIWGETAQGDPGPGRPDADAPHRRPARPTLMRRRRQRGRRRAAEVHHRQRDRHRRLGRDPEPAPGHPQRPGDHHAAAAGRACRSPGAAAER